MNVLFIHAGSALIKLYTYTLPGEANNLDFITVCNMRYCVILGKDISPRHSSMAAETISGWYLQIDLLINNCTEFGIDTLVGFT